MYEFVEGIALSAVATSVGGAQTPEAKPKVDPVFVDDVSIVVDPIKPQPKERAELETYGECLTTSPEVLAPYQHAAIAATQQYSYKSVGKVTIRLATKIEKGAQVCVVERIYAEDDTEGSYVKGEVFSQVKAEDKSRPGSKLAFQPSSVPSIEPVYIDDGSIIVMPVQPEDTETADIETYRSCTPNVQGGAANGQNLAIAGTQQIDSDTIGPLVLQLADRLKKGDSVCVIEYIYRTQDENGKDYGSNDPRAKKVERSLVSELKTAVQTRKEANLAPFASGKSARNYVRITTGIDVSAAASADPAAHFMADLSFDVPFANFDSSLYNRFSSNGYLRLASIAQPGKINGIATPATYIKPLTDSTPNNLVQSWEGNVAFAVRLNPRLYLGEQGAYWTASAIVDGGFITPISASQTDTVPVVYVANQAIYDFYTKTPVANATAAKAVMDACGAIPSSGTFPTCYVSYIPQDRTSFFRNYAAGVTFKRYRYQGEDNRGTAYFPGADRFDFPGTATIKIGQNEYVTKGQERGLVLHGDVFWPIHDILKGNWTGPLYVFGQIDVHLRKNESSEQFVLATAASTVQRTDPKVAVIPVQQPDRDRYRFGVAVDLTTLLKAITPSSH